MRLLLANLKLPFLLRMPSKKMQKHFKVINPQLKKFLLNYLSDRLGNEHVRKCVDSIEKHFARVRDKLRREDNLFDSDDLKML